MKTKPRKRSMSPKTRVEQSSKASRSPTRRENRSRAKTRENNILLELDKASNSTEMSQVGHTQLSEVCKPLQPAASTLPSSASLLGSISPGQWDNPPADSLPVSPDVPQPGYPSYSSQVEAAQLELDEIYSLDPSVDQAEIKRWDHKAFLEGSYYHQPLHDLWCKLSVYVNNFISASAPIKCMWHLLDDKTKGELISFCPLSPRIIEDGNKGCHHLMLAWVWRILYDNLLSPDCTD
jgi:hypothetical protein